MVYQHISGDSGGHSSGRHRLFKWLILAGVAALVLVVGLIALIVSSVMHLTSFTLTGLQQIAIELWQTANGWFQPVIDLYERTVKLIPGQGQ